MSKWISDAYIKRLLQNNRLLQGNCEYKLWEQEVENTVDAMPSIDIVRCRECRYFIDNLTEDDTDEAYGECCFDWDIKMPKADDFCSYGQKGDENVETD